MTKIEFLTALEKRLSGLPEVDIRKSLDFYGEMLDDRIEEGATEGEAVASLGGLEEIVGQILAEIPLVKLVGHKIKPKRRLRGWEITLLILGFPLWLPLLGVAASVLLTCIVVFWSVVVVFYSLVFALAACGVAGILLFPLQAVAGSLAGGLLLLGCGLAAVGGSMFAFFAADAVAKTFFRASKAGFLALKRSILKKEA